MRNGARPRRMPNALTSTYLAAKTARSPAISATIPATSPARSATVAAGSRLAARPISCAWGHRRPGWRSPATFPARPFIRSLGAPTQTTPDFPQSATSTKTRLRQKRQDLRQDRQASQHRPLCTSQKRENEKIRSFDAHRTGPQHVFQQKAAKRRVGGHRRIAPRRALWYTQSV